MRKPLCSLLQSEGGSTWIWEQPVRQLMGGEGWESRLQSFGFGGSTWLDPPSSSEQPANILLLLHGLGDTPAPFLRFARAMALPQTAVLALSGPLPLPGGLDGKAWHESFEEDGSLIRPLPHEVRRRRSLIKHSREPLCSLLNLLQENDWPPHRVFLFGFSQVTLVTVSCQVCGTTTFLGFPQGGTAALDLAMHAEIQTLIQVGEMAMRYKCDCSAAR